MADVAGSIGPTTVGHEHAARLEQQAWAAAERQDWHEAVQLARARVALQADPAWHRHLSGFLVSADGPAAGVDDAIAAADGRPDDVDFAVHAAGLLNAVGRHEDARQRIEHAIKVSGASAALLWQLAWTTEQCGDFAGAAKLALRAFAAAPDDADVAVGAADLTWRLGYRDDATAILRHAAALPTATGRVHRTLSGYLGETGDLAGALSACAAAIAALPRNGEFQIHRSGLLLRLGQFAAAREAAETATALEPDNLAARRHLVTVCLESGDIDAPQQLATDLLRAAPAHDEYARRLMNVLSRKLDAGEALPDVLARKREAGARRPRPAETVAQSVATHFRVIGALFLREVRTRFGESRLGYLWALIEPAIHIGALAVVFQFTMNGQPPLGQSFFLFYLTGLVPYHLLLHTIDHVGHAIENNRPLLMLPPVTHMRCILARALVELVTETIVALMFLIGFWCAGIDALPRDVGAFGTALLLSWMMGLAIGTFSAVIGVFTSAWTRALGILHRALYFCSGIFYAPTMMPAGVRDILA